MGPLAISIMLVVAGAFFLFTMQHRVRLLARAQARPAASTASAAPGAALAVRPRPAALVDPEGALRRASCTCTIFVSFLVLAARTITLFGMGYSLDFHLPFWAKDLPLGRGYLFLKDVILVVAFVASIYFIVRARVATKPDRMTQSWEAYLILGFIAALMVTDMMFEGATRAPRRARRSIGGCR